MCKYVGIGGQEDDFYTSLLPDRTQNEELPDWGNRMLIASDLKDVKVNACVEYHPRYGTVVRAVQDLNQGEDLLLHPQLLPWLKDVETLESSTGWLMGEKYEVEMDNALLVDIDRLSKDYKDIIPVLGRGSADGKVLECLIRNYEDTTAAFRREAKSSKEVKRAMMRMVDMTVRRFRTAYELAVQNHKEWIAAEKEDHEDDTNTTEVLDAANVEGDQVEYDQEVPCDEEGDTLPFPQGQALVAINPDTVLEETIASMAPQQQQPTVSSSAPSLLLTNLEEEKPAFDILEDWKIVIEAEDSTLKFAVSVFLASMVIIRNDWRDVKTEEANYHVIPSLVIDSDFCPEIKKRQRPRLAQKY